MRLSEFIQSNLEVLLQEWEQYAVSVHSGKTLNQEKLRDHAKEMLCAIAADLTTPQTGKEQSEKSKGHRDFNKLNSYYDGDDSAHQHGVTRSQVGFSIDEVVSEFRALRASVLRLWSKASKIAMESDLADMTRFNEAIDQALAASIDSYASAKEQQTRLFETILAFSPDHSCVLDLNGRFIYANHALESTLKLSSSALQGKSLFDLGLSRAEEISQQIVQVIQTKQPIQTELNFSRTPSGHDGIYEYVFAPILTHDGTVEAIAGTARDISERKAADEEIWHNANYDLLTGLPNRRLFHDRLEQEVKHSERNGVLIALLFIDLDRFKEANDMLGHDAGDMLLRQAAERIRSCIRQKDTVARLGGDEFTVILTEFEELKDVQIVAGKILHEMAKPFTILQELIHISASIGITMFPQDAATPEHLIRNADQAMYAAKSAGRNRFIFYTRDMQTIASARFKLIADLRNALSQMQLAVYYQPIVDLSDGSVSKAEALVRWLHPQMGLVLPGEFIGLAEETGMITEIGNWIFMEATLHAQKWGELLRRPFQVSINQSPLQLMNHTHSMNWIAHLQQIGLESQNISVEITESVLLNVADEVTEKLGILHKAGVQLSIDDFGTGYSSMSYLKKFDVDYLKIDQSFVQGMTADGSSKTIAETIIVMAHKLGLKVIAEGVETPEQRDWLMDAGCDYAQGFLFAPPLPPQEFAQRFIH
ncbi:MAG TPA: EAL domain-containing protein [Noviherbaspirillum sp.]|nr:EAL domain-containing protein [Noviherbaspirillum sp.]